MQDAMKEEREPIFIIGSARSGTSAVVLALRTCAGIAGYNEGHYLTLMHKLMRLSTEYILEQRQKNKSPEVMMSHVRADEFADGIMRMMKSRMEAHFPDQKVWMDKTPDGLMMRIIPYLVAMWPKARFIFCKRRAIDNVMSRLRKFQHLTFEQNCERWEIAMSLWMKMRDHIPASQRIEIDQYEMGVHPEKTAGQICNFLGLTKDQEKAMGQFFGGERTEFTGANEKAVRGLHDLGWTEEQIETYDRICAPMNRECGYSDGPTYYL